MHCLDYVPSSVRFPKFETGRAGYSGNPPQPIFAGIEMLTAGSIFDALMQAFMFMTVLLYIRCQIALYVLIKRGPREKMATYFYLVYFCGFVSLLVIANQVFFQLLPTLIWKPFFYNLGSAGARIHFMVSFGTEMFIVLSEAFIAISRYLTFTSKDLARNYWNIPRVRVWLLGILGVSIAYVSIYFFCNFTSTWDPDYDSVRFTFAVDTLNWVGVSMFVPFTVATASFLSCVYCYWKVATIIRSSQTGLTRATVMRMCLSSTIISFGAFLSLFVRIVNHISFLLIDEDIIPVAAYLYLIRVGAIIATCGNPWILIALFPTVREQVFPCLKKKNKVAISAFTTAIGAPH
ncbi:hypothetical protein Y032_0069g313 [Ancylostoma ceylanicum]|nr:hypothetical protein Y032_0069g313 [Ancylostoma ceylanicum]